MDNPMKLDAWLKENRWNGVQFGEKIGVGKAMVSLFRHGKARPTAATMARISEFTNGEVTEADFNGGNDAERI